jgi:hypothetical protein
LETDNTKNAALLRAASFLKPCDIRFESWWNRFLLGSQDLYIFETLETTDADRLNASKPAAEKPRETVLGLLPGAAAGLPGATAMTSLP